MVHNRQNAIKQADILQPDVMLVDLM